MSAKAVYALRAAALAIAAALIGVIAYATWFVAPIGTPVITGTADVGGPFRLTDTAGRSITERDLRGKALVIYFGWSLDPDLTPAALQVLASALSNLGPKSERLTPVFISVDPDRDTPSKLNDFVNKIDKKLVALIGSAEETAAISKAFKHYFKKLPDPSLPGGYSIDHASLYYVMGSDGGFLGVVPHTTDSAALALELNRLMK